MAKIAEREKRLTVTKMRKREKHQDSFTVKYKESDVRGRDREVRREKKRKIESREKLVNLVHHLLPDCLFGTHTRLVYVSLFLNASPYFNLTPGEGWIL